MNLDHASAIVAAVLYEGYILYPYRPSSVKNRQRWTFGGVFPARVRRIAAAAIRALCRPNACCAATRRRRWNCACGFCTSSAREIGALPERLAELPATGEPAFTPVASLEIEGVRHLAWEEAVEREVVRPDRYDSGNCWTALTRAVRVPRQPRRSRRSAPRPAASPGMIIRTASNVQGRVTITAAAAAPGAFRLTRSDREPDPAECCEVAGRDLAQRRAFASTHTLLGVQGGAFVSMIDPPEDLREAAARCDNQGAWPVLVGPAGARDTDAVVADHPLRLPGDRPGKSRATCSTAPRSTKS